MITYIRKSIAYFFFAVGITYGRIKKVYSVMVNYFLQGHNAK